MRVPRGTKLTSAELVELCQSAQHQGEAWAEHTLDMWFDDDGLGQPVGAMPKAPPDAGLAEARDLLDGPLQLTLEGRGFEVELSDVPEPVRGALPFILLAAYREAWARTWEREQLKGGGKYAGAGAVLRGGKARARLPAVECRACGDTGACRACAGQGSRGGRRCAACQGYGQCARCTIDVKRPRGGRRGRVGALAGAVARLTK